MMSDVARSLACSLVRTASSVVAVAGLGVALPVCVSDAESLSARIHLPPGFDAEVYAQVPNARSLAVARRAVVDADDEIVHYLSDVGQLAFHAVPIR